MRYPHKQRVRFASRTEMSKTAPQVQVRLDQVRFTLKIPKISNIMSLCENFVLIENYQNVIFPTRCKNQCSTNNNEYFQFYPSSKNFISQKKVYIFSKSSEKRSRQRLGRDQRKILPTLGGRELLPCSRLGLPMLGKRGLPPNVFSNLPSGKYLGRDQAAI